MALSAKELEREDFLRVLLMGPAKIGKTTTVVATSPGPVRVLLCEHDSALKHSVRLGVDFTFDRVTGWNTMSKALLEAKRDCKEEGLGTVVVDPFSEFAANLLDECLNATDTGRGPDGRRAYPEYNKRIRHVLNQLFRLPCHVVVITHYIDTGGGEVRPDGGGDPTPQTGEGIVPLLAGKARALVAAQFPDVVWMDYVKGDRVLVTGPRGAWGPGCRSLGETRILPADVMSGKKNVGIRALLKAFREGPEPRNESATSPTTKRDSHAASDRAHEKQRHKQPSR
jgi:hypothetical protein